MQQLHHSANPFALMLDPQAVFARIEHSGGLQRLSRRVCRPLDKPLLGVAVDDGMDDESDRAADASADIGEASNDRRADASALAPDQ